MTFICRFLIASLLVFIAIPAQAENCRKVAPIATVQIDRHAAQDLAVIGVGRNEIFEAIKETSIPETGGCWASASGNFDGMLVSVGIAQWNYGSGSLQKLLKTYKAKYGAQFQSHIRRLMPEYGSLIFSEGCLRSKITAECNDKLLALQAPNGKLIDTLEREVDALFESDAMIQIQTDEYVRLLTSVKSNLQEMFPGQTPTKRQIKWAVDTRVQQGRFPAASDIARVRTRLRSMNSGEMKAKLLSLVLWYEGLCTSADQGGVRLDCEWNVQKWRKCIETGKVDAEQADLLYLSHLNGRVSKNLGGLWQALTFQRRAKIILGVGSVGGGRVDSCVQTTARN